MFGGSWIELADGMPPEVFNLVRLVSEHQNRHAARKLAEHFFGNRLDKTDIINVASAIDNLMKGSL